MVDHRVETQRVRWAVGLTGQFDDVLQPVRLIGRAERGAFSVQDYLTPAEARALAAGLVEAACAAELAEVNAARASA